MFNKLPIKPITSHISIIKGGRVNNAAGLSILNLAKGGVALQIYRHNLAMLFVVFEVANTNFFPGDYEYAAAVRLAVSVDLALI